MCVHYFSLSLSLCVFVCVISSQIFGTNEMKIYDIPIISNVLHDRIYLVDGSCRIHIDFSIHKISNFLDQAEK